MPRGMEYDNAHKSTLKDLLMTLGLGCWGCMIGAQCGGLRVGGSGCRVGVLWWGAGGTG